MAAGAVCTAWLINSGRKADARREAVQTLLRAGVKLYSAEDVANARYRFPDGPRFQTAGQSDVATRRGANASWMRRLTGDLFDNNPFAMIDIPITEPDDKRLPYYETLGNVDILRVTFSRDTPGAYNEALQRLTHRQSLHGLYLKNPRVSPEVLGSVLDRSRKLTHMTIRGQTISSENIQQIAALSNLQQLAFIDCDFSVTEIDFSSFTELRALQFVPANNANRPVLAQSLPRELTTLILQGPGIHHEQLRNSLPTQLETLALNSVQLDLSKPASTGLQVLKNLRHLELRKTSVSREVISLLPRTLTSLALDATAATDDWMPDIRRFDQLTDLSLTQTDVTALGLQHLVQLPQLTRLSLNASIVDLRSVEALSRAPRLQHLSIAFPSIDVLEANLDAVREIRAKYPMIQIQWNVFQYRH